MVQVIRDDFNRPDGAIGPNWEVFAVNGGGITILETTAVGTVGGGGLAFAVARSLSSLDEVEQEARLSFIMSDGDPVPVGIFRLGFHSVGTPGTMGFAVDVRVQTPTLFQLNIVQNPFQPATTLSPGDATLVLASPLLVNGTSADVVQELRAALRRSAAGVELLVYLNEDNDDRPIMRWRFNADVPAGGRPYFGVWHDADASFARVAEVAFSTRATLSAVSASESFFEHRPMLREIRDGAIEWYEKRVHSPNVDGQIVDRAVNDAQRSIINRLGDLALFMRIEEDITLEISSPQRIASFPRRVGRILKLSLQSATHEAPPVEYHVIGHDPDGRLRVSIPSAPNNLRMLYEPVVDDMIGAEDRALIPREFRECLIAATVKRMCRGDASKEVRKEAQEAFDEAFAEMTYAMQRHQRSRIGPLRVVLRTPDHSSLGGYENWRGY